MSMMRASGAIPTITALQMATASLATPKSVMKTMVGRGADFFAESSGCVAVVAQPMMARDSADINRNETTTERVGKSCKGSPLHERGIGVFILGMRWAEIITHASKLPRHRSAGGLGSFAILLVEVAMLVVAARELTFDEEIADLGLQFEWVAVGYDYVCYFSGLDGADLVCQAENLRGVEHHGFEGFVVR